MRQDELQMRDLRDYIYQSSPPASDENDPAATRRRLSDAGPIAYRLNTVPFGYVVYVAQVYMEYGFCFIILLFLF